MEQEPDFKSMIKSARNNGTGISNESFQKMGPYERDEERLHQAMNTNNYISREQNPVDLDAASTNAVNDLNNSDAVQRRGTTSLSYGADLPVLPEEMEELTNAFQDERRATKPENQYNEQGGKAEGAKTPDMYWLNTSSKKASASNPLLEAIHQLRYGESFQKSIANQETADYLKLKYRPYSRAHGRKRAEMENPHQPSIETTIDALQSQQKERDRINDEWWGNSLAGDKAGRREADALAESMRQQGKSDEEIREALSELSGRYIPNDYDPDYFDDPWDKWNALEAFAGIIQHPDTPGYVVGRFDNPKADPVESAVRNNVRQQMALYDTKENVGALASASVNRYNNTNYPEGKRAAHTEEVRSNEEAPKKTAPSEEKAPEKTALSEEKTTVKPSKEKTTSEKKSAANPLLDAYSMVRYGHAFQKADVDELTPMTDKDENEDEQNPDAKVTPDKTTGVSGGIEPVNPNPVHSD